MQVLDGKCNIVSSFLKDFHHLMWAIEYDTMDLHSLCQVLLAKRQKIEVK